MKKKIKDLTLKEIKKICEQHSVIGLFCVHCPFFNKGLEQCESVNRLMISEREVEVDESNND